MTLKSHTKFEEKLTCGLENDMRNLANFHQFIEELCVMTLKNDEKLKRNDLPFRIWQKEFDEFWLEHSKVSKIYTLIGCFWPKYMMFELKKYRKLYFMTLESDAKFEEQLICGLENDIRNLQILTRAHESLKIGTVIESFYPK